MAASSKLGAFVALLAASSRAMGCLLDNTDYPGFDIDRLEGKVFSAMECQRQCQAKKDCLFFTYQPATNSCYMKGEGATPSKVEGLISGPRICPAPPECSLEGVDLFGGDIIDTEVSNAQACQVQCTAVKGCVFFTFVSSTKRCYLKDSNVEPTPQEGVISGPRICPGHQPLSCEQTTDFLGHDIRSFYGSVDSAQSCQELCKGLSNCFYFTYVEQTKSCYLKDETAPEAREYNPLTFSGSRDCDMSIHPTVPISTTTTAAPAASCLLQNVDYFGHDLTAFGLGMVTGPAACRVICQFTRECFFFTFYQGNCYFKTAGAPEAMVTKEGAISGPKYCTDVDPSSTTTTTSSPANPTPGEATTEAEILRSFTSTSTPAPSLDALLRRLLNNKP